MYMSGYRSEPLVSMEKAVVPFTKKTWSAGHTPAVGFGLWFMVYGLCLMVHGLWSMIYGLWIMVSGFWFLVYSLWIMDYGS